VERLTEIVTHTAIDQGCSYNFVGSGTLLWRDTTITVTWSTALAC
jgi:hypothetical protein